MDEWPLPEQAKEGFIRLRTLQLRFATECLADAQQRLKVTKNAFWLGLVACAGQLPALIWGSLVTRIGSGILVLAFGYILVWDIGIKNVGKVKRRVAYWQNAEDEARLELAMLHDGKV